MRINYLRNRFELLTEMVQDKVKLLLVSETKINSSFPDDQYEILFKTITDLIRKSKRWGIILKVKKYISSELIKSLN